MALPYLTVVLTIVLFNLGSSRQQAHTSVCEERYSGCVGFLNKQDNFSSYRQCLKACDFKNVPGAKSLTAYSCIDRNKPCSPLTFYKTQLSLDPFFDWSTCLQVCHLLTNDNGETSASGDICMEPKSDCFSFANSEGDVDKFMKCYVDCQINKKETQTYLHYVYLCSPNHKECIDSTFFTRPEEQNPKQVLTKCYENCGTGKGPEPKAGGYKCDEDSRTCVACTDEDGGCADLSTCEESCGKEAPEPKTDGYKCDEDSKTCVACTDADGDCLDLSACEESCGKEAPEPTTDGYKCDEDSKTCVACTDADGDCLDLSACEESCADDSDGVTYKCDENSKTCVPCTEGDENCSDFYTCDEICQDES
ncbi:hypothetical protein SprV_0802553500 [Sparganum proliferum]